MVSLLVEKYKVDDTLVTLSEFSLFEIFFHYSYHYAEMKFEIQGTVDFLIA